MIARVAMALVALAAAAAFVVWLRSSRAEGRAEIVVFAPPRTQSPAAIEKALGDARDARRLGPDVPAELLEALLERRAGRLAASNALFVRATRDEPDNTNAWLLLANTTRDPATFRWARAEVRRLNPLLSAKRR